MKVHSYYMYYQTSDNANRGISFEKFLFLPTLVYHPRPGFLKRQKNWSFIASNSLAFIETLLLAHIIRKFPAKIIPAKNFTEKSQKFQISSDTQFIFPAKIETTLISRQNIYGCHRYSSYISSSF